MSNKSIQKRFDVIRTLFAIGISLALAFLIIFAVSEDPISAISNFVFGPLTNFRRFSNVLELAVPLTFCGLAVSIMFSANQTIWRRRVLSTFPVR